MNKIILLNILKKLIIKYKNNELDEATYNEILNNYEFCNITNEQAAYAETSLLTLLFKTIPYYQVFPFVINLITHLHSISTNENSKFITNLIEGILCELTTNLNNRIITETNSHIYKLASLIFIEDTLDYTRTINFLRKNSIIPEQLVGLDAAENAKFKQEILPTFIVETEDLREKISKKNYNQKSSIERKLITIFTRFFNPESFSNFESELNTILAHYKNENHEEADLIHDTLFEQIVSLKKTILKNWQKQNEEISDSPEQLSIFTLSKKPRNANF